MRPLAILFAGAVLLLAACGGGDDRVGELLPVDEREPAPAVTGTTVGGEQMSLADLEGPVVVNFWGSWCGPCIQEAPELQRLYRHYQPQGVAFLGVNVRDSQRGAERFEEEVGKPYPSLVDRPGEIAAAFGGIGPAVMPSTLLLDHEHRVAVRLFGATNYGQVQDLLEPLLAERDGEVDDAAELVR